MEKIFLHDEIYELDDIDLGLMIEFTDGKVTNLRSIPGG